MEMHGEARVAMYSNKVTALGLRRLRSHMCIQHASPFVMIAEGDSRTRDQYSSLRY